jgi:hypothetical protein
VIIVLKKISLQSSIFLRLPQIINFTIFILVEFIYIYSIQEVNKHNKNISDQISSSSIIATLFANKDFEIIIPKKRNGESKKRVSNNSNTSTYGLDSNSEEMIKQCLIASISTDQTTDWLVLQKIVSEKWETFKLFGIELTDTKIISRIFGLIVGLLISSELLELVNWWN